MKLLKCIAVVLPLLFSVAFSQCYHYVATANQQGFAPVNSQTDSIPCYSYPCINTPWLFIGVRYNGMTPAHFKVWGHPVEANIIILDECSHAVLDTCITLGTLEPQAVYVGIPSMSSYSVIHIAVNAIVGGLNFVVIPDGPVAPEFNIDLSTLCGSTSLDPMIPGRDRPIYIDYMTRRTVEYPVEGNIYAVVRGGRTRLEAYLR